MRLLGGVTAIHSSVREIKGTGKFWAQGISRGSGKLTPRQTRRNGKITWLSQSDHACHCQCKSGECIKKNKLIPYLSVASQHTKRGQSLFMFMAEAETTGNGWVADLIRLKIISSFIHCEAASFLTHLSSEHHSIKMQFSSPPCTDI